MTQEERDHFFDNIPDDRFLVHNWRTDVVKIGEIRASLWPGTEGISDEHRCRGKQGAFVWRFDLIVSMGQVVPTKSWAWPTIQKTYLSAYFTGINKSYAGRPVRHGRMMGRDKTPVRRIFDYAQEHFLADLKIKYMQTVTTNDADGLHIHGLFIGENRDVFRAGVELAQKKNIIFVDRSPSKSHSLP